MDPLRPLKTLLKARFAEHVWRQPVSGLQPERLYAYLDALYQRRELDGAVLEVGCHRGGTAALANGLLRRVGAPKRYVCVDTFGGFVTAQFEHDARRGAPERLRAAFTESSLPLVRRLLNFWGHPEIALLQSDIVALPADQLPERVAVCLLDVDLEVPIYEGLLKIVPRLVPGGAVLVDDCGADTPWVGARRGYARFVEEAGLPATYRFGMGVIER